MHKLYRKVQVYQTERDRIMSTDNWHFEYRRDEQAEADAEVGCRARQAELYGLKAEHRTLSELEEEIAEIHRGRDEAH